MLVLDPVAFLNMHIRFAFWWSGLLSTGSYYIGIGLILLLTFLFVSFITFPYFIAVSKTSNIILPKSRKSEYLCLIFYFRGNALSPLHTFNIIFALLIIYNLCLC